MQHLVLDLFAQISSEAMIRWGGFAIIILLVYIETAFLIGLVVPGGETLLFAAGLLSGTEALNVGIAVMIPVLIGAAMAGDITAYFIGKKWGTKIYDKKDTWYFKKSYLKKAEAFYHKHDKSSLIIGRFIPMIRTFNPFFCGTIHMKFHLFLRYVIIGIVLYVGSLITLGYFLGKSIPGLERYLKYILPVVALLASIPVLVKFVREKRKAKAA